MAQGAGAPSRDRRKRRPILVVGAERALPRGKVMTDAGALQLEPRNRLEVAGQEPKPHVVAR
jgi:hypothetical protein